MVISVDHGNKFVKVKRKLFVSGLIENDSKPPFGEETIFYDGRYYTVSKHRAPYLQRKMENDQYYILNLAAMAHAIDQAGAYSADDIIDVHLLVGLPPKHYGPLKDGFEKYFLRDNKVIDFLYCDKPYSIFISKVLSYPQAYAAAMLVYAKLSDIRRANVIDIGGHTLDYLQILQGGFDLSICDTLNQGLDRLYSTIQSNVNSDTGISLNESDIDDIIDGKIVEVDDKTVQLVMQGAQAFVNESLDMLRERRVELKFGKTIFVGGGSIRLRRQIEASGKVAYPLFVDNIFANAEGYMFLYQLAQAMG